MEFHDSNLQNQKYIESQISAIKFISLVVSETLWWYVQYFKEQNKESTEQPIYVSHEN